MGGHCSGSGFNFRGVSYKGRLVSSTKNDKIIESQRQNQKAIRDKLSDIDGLVFRSEPRLK